MTTAKRWRPVARKLCNYSVLVFVPLAMASAAHAKTDLVVTGSVRGQAASNPYLTSGIDRSVVSAVVSLSPTLTFSDAESEIQLSGTVQHTEFARLYPSSQAASAGLNGKWRLSPRWSVNTSARFNTSIVGENGIFNFDRIQLPTIGDISLIGARTRQRSLEFQTGATYQPSARDTFNFGLFASDFRVLGSLSGLSNASYGGNASYSRQISARSSVGLSGNAVRFECRSLPSCQVDSYQPELTFSTQLSSFWTLNASAGATISRLRLPSESGTSISPAGSVSLCRRDPRLSFCLGANRSIAPSSSNGARPSTSITSSLKYQLTQKESIGFNVAYAESGASALRRDTYSFFSARVSGERQIARRVSMYVDGGYDSSSDPIIGRRGNVSVSLGLNFSLGRGI